MTPTPETLDPAIYSGQSEWVTNPELPEGGSFVPITWRQLAEELAAEVARLRAFRTMVFDLDRNRNGRHEGDADVGDPSGVSRGNPLLRTGEVIGWTIRGSHAYVVPERGRRHDLSAWLTPVER